MHMLNLLLALTLLWLLGSRPARGQDRLSAELIPWRERLAARLDRAELMGSGIQQRHGIRAGKVAGLGVPPFRGEVRKAKPAPAPPFPVPPPALSSSIPK